MSETKTDKHVVLVLDDSAHMKGQQRRVVDGINAFVDRLSDKTWVHLYRFHSGELILHKQCLAKTWVPLLKQDLETLGTCSLYQTIGLLLDSSDSATDILDGGKVMLVFDVGGETERFDTKKDRKRAIKEVRQLLEKKDSDGWGLFFLGFGDSLVDAHLASRQAEDLGIPRMGAVNAIRVKAYKRLAKMTKNFFAHGTFYSLT